jgi:phage-related minor tail protein
MNTLAPTALAPATTTPSAAGFTLAEGYYLVQNMGREMHGMAKRGKVEGRAACSGGRFSKARAAVLPSRVLNAS